MNLPIGGLALIALALWLPRTISVRSSRERGLAALRRIDVIGAFTAAGATICLLLGLTWGGSIYPWDSVQVIAAFAAAAVLYL
ncbi:MAG: MFS transporter, partial [Gammaproteobacteria bacterium]